MNRIIYALSEDPKECVEEAITVLPVPRCTIHNSGRILNEIHGGEIIVTEKGEYLDSCEDNPWVEWGRASSDNYEWLFAYFIRALELVRNKGGADHRWARFAQVLSNNPSPDGPLDTDFPVNMDKAPSVGSSVEKHRIWFYNRYKPGADSKPDNSIPRAKTPRPKVLSVNPQEAVELLSPGQLVKEILIWTHLMMEKDTWPRKSTGNWDWAVEFVEAGYKKIREILIKDKKLEEKGRTKFTVNGVEVKTETYIELSNAELFK